MSSNDEFDFGSLIYLSILATELIFLLGFGWFCFAAFTLT